MAENDNARALYEATKNEDLAAELELRGLEKTGTKPEMVERLVAHDAEAAKAAPEEKPAAAICSDCWPAGWPAEAHSASCVHGEWLNE